ncbi:hypothetical protein Y032_0004g1751 [Ancylostoma ceylanicum]|uniref:Uncharacterized protein n=1 Tax=Ancylostoma ceylanicum TaxID=53326 RepID=A0A016VUN4_9BILA|nr:hypothetical protein Y032_0004g1751 [Ancylostoma ceylanicum]
MSSWNVVVILVFSVLRNPSELSVGTRKRLILFEHGSSVGYKRGGTLLVEVLEDQFCDVGKSGVRRYHEVFSNEVCLVGVVGVIRTEYVFFELRKSLMTSHFK